MAFFRSNLASNVCLFVCDIRKKTMVRYFVLLSLLVACKGNDFKESKTFVGNQVVEADTLNLGKQVYIEYCAACHGMKGDGNGQAAKGSFPPPRNFKQGLYKFAYVAEAALPTDEDFKRIIQHGLNGTAMLKWDISEKQTYAVTQYIKTFAPQVWESKDNEKGVPLDFIKDPYGAARQEYAIQKGKEVYHGVADCQSCHRAYVSFDELSQINEKINGEPLDDRDSDIYKLKLQESEYYFHDSTDRLAQFIPPDFTYHELRSINKVEDIYKRLKAGVTGTGMPAWGETLTDEEIWATAYYVQSLVNLRGAPERTQMIKSLRNQ